MKILVTGGTGFTGSRVVALLVSGRHDVVVLCRSESGMSSMRALGATSIRGDLDDIDSANLASAFAGVEAVVNLVSLGFGHAPSIVGAAEAAGVRRVIFVSTTAVDTSLTPASKRIRLDAERQIVASDLDWTIVRPTMIYGATGDRNMSRLLQALQRSPVFPLPGGGRHLQQPVHVDDLASAIVSAVQTPNAIGRLYVIAGPEPLTFREVVEQAAVATGRSPRLFPIPLRPAVATVRMYERVSEHPRIKAEQLERLAEDKVFDIAPARNDLDYHPRSFLQGIGEEARGLTPRANWMDDVGPVLRTVRHLKVRQISSRIRLRWQKAAFSRWGTTLVRRLAVPVREEWGWPAAFEPLDPRIADGAPTPEANSEGTFTFLDETRWLGDPFDWIQSDASQLWRYHLHYWEWAWALARVEDRSWGRDTLARLRQSWESSTYLGRWDAWSPYVVSVRTWVLCGLHAPLVAGATWETKFVADIALQAGYVAANLERDVGGNHLIKNIKALVGAGVFLRDDQMVERATFELCKQIDVQILPDGGHYERSPSYHCQVLGDLIDVEGLLAAASRPPVTGLRDAIERMRGWLGAMILPDGSVPLLNDCARVSLAHLEALAPIAPQNRELTILQPSGYVVIRKGRWHLIADVGPPCPPELPAHAHADTLSFVLCVDGRQVIVDTGTSEYGHGLRRQYERSTAAHNTVEIDGQNSTEVFGAFRAGRRGWAHLDWAGTDGGRVIVAAHHDGYRYLTGAPIHHRLWSVTGDALEIRDEVRGAGMHEILGRLHYVGAACTRPDGALEVGPISLTGRVDGVVSLQPQAELELTSGSAESAPRGCVQLRAMGLLPMTITVGVGILGTSPASA